MAEQAITPIRICLIDNHKIVLYGLEKLIDSQKPKMEVVGKFLNCVEAFSQIEELSPDVILLDLNLSNKDEVATISKMLTLLPAKILIFTCSQDFSIYDSVMLSGAKGIISKEESVEIILKAIEKVQGGEIWLDQNSINRLLNEARQKKSKISNFEDRINKLTPAEKRVLSVIMNNVGSPAKVLAVKLDICESTLRNHLTSIYEKLDVSNKLELWSLVYTQELNQQL